MKQCIWITLALLFVLVGCSTQKSMEISSGEVLSPEEQASLFEERSKSESEPNLSVKGTVYWTESGEKYHKDADCSYLKNAAKLYSGTAAEAANHGASSPCSRCAQ